MKLQRDAGLSNNDDLLWAIHRAIVEKGGGGVRAIKDALPETMSYGQIKVGACWLKRAAFASKALHLTQTAMCW